MAYKSIFEEEEIKPATTPKASTGYVSIFDDEEKKPETALTQEVQKPKYLGDLLRSQPPVEKPKPILSGRYVQDEETFTSIPFEKAPLKKQIENLTPEELRKMKTSELYELKRVAGMEEGDAKQWYSSLMAGFGDVADIVGSTMKWQGAEGGLIDRIGENLQEVGRATQSKYTDYEALEKLGDFNWGDMASPSFWQNKVPRLLPFSMSLIPAALIGGAAGTAIGAGFGLGALATTVIGAVGGAALSRPLEGMMEAGSTYDEAIAKGLSEEKAQEAANEVFIENLKQMSVLDVVQMLPFIKNIKGFKIPNSTLNKIVNIVGTTGAVASEGLEEVLQNRIVANALGEKFDLASPETKESFVLGTIMGGIFQGTGGIVNISQRAITNATKENLSKKNQAIFEKNFDKFMKEGETRSDSEALALNEVAKIDQKGLQDAITKALNEKSQELKDAGIEQQASTVLKEETPADKLAKQIKKSDPIDRLLATIEEQEVETKAEVPLTKITGKRIPTLEKEISSIYKKSGKAEEMFDQVLAELEVAEAGKRFSTEEGDWTGIKSTFPKWIPEHLRSRDLFNKVMGGLSDPNNIKYPEANKTKQRELYNFILDEIDSRLEVDTKDIRNNILEKYEQGAKRQVQGTANKSTTRAVRNRGRAKQTTIDGKKVKPEAKSKEQSGLNLKPEKDAMAKKIKPPISSEDYIAQKEEALKKKAEGQSDIFSEEDLPMFQELSSLARNMQEYEGLNLTLDDSVKLFRKLFSTKEMNFAFSDEIRMGGINGRFVPKDMYSQNFLSLVELLKKNGKVSESTLYHEAFHAYFYAFVSKEERQRVLNIVKNSKLTEAGRKRLSKRRVYRNKGEDKIAEEWIAYDFARYVADKNGIKHKGLTGFFEKITNHLRTLIRKKATLDKIYEDILSKKRPEEVMTGKDELRQIWEKANKSTKFSEKNINKQITTKDALAQAQDFAIVRDTNIPIKAVETIIENPRAFGKYQKGTIEFIYNPDITTIPHEIGHYWFEAMLTKDQQTEVLREYKEWFIKNKPNKARPDTRNGWEEAMVQDMAEYYSKKYTKKKGKIERFWDWFIYQIKRVLNKNDFIARFTYDVRTKSIDRNVSKRKLADSLNQTGAIRTNGGIIIPDETKGQAFRRKIQDINTRLDTTVRTLREGGVVIPESQDIFLSKTLLPRRIGGATEKFANEVMNPLINAMAKDGVDLDNLNLYLHAMHAPERNRKMNELRKAENDKRNRQRVEPKPYFPVDGLSGMTDAEARSVINTFKEMGIASKLEEHRISLQKISKATLLFQLKEGLLSQEEYDAIRGSYENYVPLGRDIEDNAKGWGTGKGVNIKGKEIKRARGSQDLPVLPIVSQIFNRMNTAIVRAEKNRVALSVARLIKANPKIKTKTGKDLWTIKSEKYIPRYDSFGEVEYVEPLGARSQKPNEIAFKYKGKQKYLVINDPLLVRALTDEGKSKPIPYLTRYTSLLSRLATQYNPEFLIRNFSRDISESLVNVSGIAENYLTKEDTKGLKSDILKSIPKLFGAIYGYKSRKESHDAKDLIDEFIKNGGEVGYFWLEDEKTLDQKFKRQWRKSAPKGLSDKTKNQMANFMDFVGNVNSTVELVTRVSVYKALRERGMSAKQSAQIAGDITVDFNKKGEWGALISSMYMFFNAAVQGAARVFRSIKSSKKVRVMAASLFIGGFLNGIISQLWGDGDDEDYDQFIPDYKKNTRIVFADPTGKEWTVFFLPYGFGFFWAAGRSFSEVVRGKKDILESSVNVTRAFVQSFLPIDVMGGWKEFVPSSVKPLVEVATNEAWYDAPIAPDQPAYQPKIPESQRYFKTASNMSKSLSTWLNSVTGGDENRSGIVDISPEFIDYLWQQYTSGAGSFIGNVAETGYGAIKGDVKKERVPFVRSFVADVKKESVIKSNVYDIIDEGARRIFNQDKKDKFYKQVDWLIKNGSLSEDEQENIDKGNELKLNFLKGQYNFTLGDKISIVEAMDKMSDKDVNIFFESLTPRQIKSIRTGK